jgi:hypothetical protein
MIKFGVLWKNKDRAGKAYLSGAITEERFEEALALLRDGGRVMIFGNTRKREGKRDPDCILYATPKSARSRGRRSTSDAATGGGGAQDQQQDTMPDWTRGCTTCGEKPVMPATGLCGPCATGDADTAGGNW